MKAPKNYYNTVDQAKLGLDQIDKNKAAIAELQDLPVLPEATPADEGKVVKVGSDGDYELGTDENTHIEANPDDESTERLNKLKIGDTTYLVNEDVIPTVLKAVRFKINTIHGSDQNVVMNGLAFKNSINGDSYSYGGSDTITSDIEGSPDLSGLLSQAETYFASSNLPVNLTITFADGIDTTQYNDFCVKCGYYENASPLSVEVLVSADGEHFVSVAEVANLTYIRDSYVVIYEFGDVEIRIPDYTSANRGDVLSIDNTDHVVWADVPSELPSHSASDAGKVLSVDSNNEVVWGDVSGGTEQITVTPSASGGGRWDLPDGLTRHDIYERVVNGEKIEFKAISNSFTAFLIATDISNNYICFSSLYYDGTNMKARIIRLDNTTDTTISVASSGDL